MQITPELVSILAQGPWSRNRAGAAISGPIPVAGLTGGVGKVGGKLEGLESYLWVVSVDAGVAGGGPATGAGGRRRR